jgi:hypothetical protein
MTQALYAHMNNKKIKIKKKSYFTSILPFSTTCAGEQRTSVTMLLSSQ